MSTDFHTHVETQNIEPNKNFVKSIRKMALQLTTHQTMPWRHRSGKRWCGRWRHYIARPEISSGWRLPARGRTGSTWATRSGTIPSWARCRPPAVRQRPWTVWLWGWTDLGTRWRTTRRLWIPVSILFQVFQDMLRSMKVGTKEFEKVKPTTEKSDF